MGIVEGVSGDALAAAAYLAASLKPSGSSFGEFLGAT